MSSSSALFFALALPLTACGGGDEPNFRPVTRDHAEGDHAEGDHAEGDHAEGAHPEAVHEVAERPAPAGALPAPADVSAVPADATRTASGLASRVIRAGTGTTHPTASTRVRVHYTGWQSSDGRMFDSSRTRGEPAEFSLNRVIDGWTEGVQLMVEGEERRFWIPGNLAYGDTAPPGMPSGMLVFDVELLAILP